MKVNVFSLVTAFALSVSTAHAAYVAFEGIAPSGSLTTYDNTSFVADGYSFTQVHGHIIDSGFTPGGYSTHNGTDWLMNDSSGALSFSKVGGTPFALQSLELGNPVFNHADGTFARTIQGNLNGGGSIQTLLTFGSGYKTFTFDSSWSNLVSVQILSTTNGASQYALDNIQVSDAVTAAPEPATMALLGLTGLGGLGLRLRRRQMVA